MPYAPAKDATPSLALGEVGRAITPSDSADFAPPYPRSVYVGTAGNVRFLPAKNADGAYLTLPFAAGGSEPLWEASLFQRLIGSMARLDVGINGERSVRYRAKPHVVVASSTALKKADRGFKDVADCFAVVVHAASCTRTLVA